MILWLRDSINYFAVFKANEMGALHFVMTCFNHVCYLYVLKPNTSPPPKAATVYN
jgi:hypothetical protein